MHVHVDPPPPQINKARGTISIYILIAEDAMTAARIWRLWKWNEDDED